MNKSIKYSIELASAVETFLKNHHWDYTFYDGYGVFKFEMHLYGAIEHLTYIIRVGADGYMVFAITPESELKISEKTIAELAKFESRVNYDLHYGHFELDIHDGEIRYKTYTAYGEVIPDMTVIKRSIYIPAAMFEQYGQGFIDIIEKEEDAINAFLKCLRPSEKEENLFKHELYWRDHDKKQDIGDIIDKGELSRKLDEFYRHFSMSEGMDNDTKKENGKSASGKTFFKADPFATTDDGNETVENDS